MEKTMIVVMTAFLMVGCSTMQSEPAPKEFSKVYEAPGFSKEHIYNSAHEWIAQNFRSAKAVIQHHDEEEGIIIGNGRTNYPPEACGIPGYCIDWNINFTTRVDIKDEKFKLTFMNLMVDPPPSQHSSGEPRPVRTMKQMEAIKPKLLKYGDQILASMKKYEEESDW